MRGITTSHFYFSKTHNYWSIDRGQSYTKLRILIRDFLTQSGAVTNRTYRVWGNIKNPEAIRFLTYCPLLA